MRRSPLQHGTSTLRRTQMRRSQMRHRSDDRAEEDAGAWSAIKEIVNVRDLDQCQARPVLEAAAGVTRAETLCLGPNHPHHVHPVGTGGPRLDPHNVVTLCARHHRWVHEHARDAQWFGLLLPAGATANTLLEAAFIRERRAKGDKEDPSWW
jgi:hypothetical protein